jgi:transcription antitermination protein NusB
MNTRSASRELALLLLYQLEANQELSPHLTERPVLQEKLSQRKYLEDIVLAAVRSLSDQAQESIESAALDIAQVSQAMLELESEHPDNLKLPMEAENKPVKIPTTRDMLEKLESVLAAAEQLSHAVRLPELLTLAERPDVIDYAVKLANTVIKDLTPIDQWIQQGSQEWRMERMPRLDRCILRLAVGEMRFRPGVDAKVVIDEYVELAKGYSSAESYRFINGILGYVMTNELEADPDLSTPSQEENTLKQEATASLSED